MTGSADQINATTYPFTTPNPLDVTIRNQAGSVEITAAEVTETTVELVPNDSDGADLAARTLVAFSQDAGQLRIDVPDRKNLRQPPLEIIVTLPSGSTVNVDTATADVRMRGVFEGVSVNTASADVSVSHVTGRAEVNSASGDVHLNRAEGPVQIRTASGDVRLDHSAVAAAVQTASGDALLGRITGDLAARSASGDVIIATAGAVCGTSQDDVRRRRDRSRARTAALAGREQSLR